MNNEYENELLDELSKDEKTLLDNATDVLYKESVVKRSFHASQLQELKSEWKDTVEHERSELLAFLKNKNMENDDSKKVMWHSLAKNAAVRKYFFQRLIDNIDKYGNNFV